MNHQYDDQDTELLVLRSKQRTDHARAQELVDELFKLIDTGLKKIVFDCSETDYISSLDLSVLARAHTRIKKNGGDLKLCSVNPQIHEVLEITRLVQVFDIRPDLEQARQAFQGQ